MSSAWLHNLDPFLIQFSGSIGVRWYGLAYVSGFILSFLFLKWFSEKKLTPMTVEQASDFITANILGVLLGGRIGYALFYSPELLTDFRPAFPFWGVLAVWEGGMASHGGFLGVWIACFYFAKKHKIQFPHLGDLTIVGASMGIFLGRIANFINGELFGRISTPDFPLAVKFPQEIHRWIGYTPEKITRLKDAAMTLNISPSDWNKWIDNIPAYKSKFYGLADQIIFQVQEGNSQLIEALRPALDPRHPSQLYAALTEALIPLLVVLAIWRTPKKPGIIGSIFIIIYSMGRIFNEQFRLPDAHISNLAEQPLGLSRGQFISLWMMVVGFAFLIWSMKRKSEPMGGWGRK